MADPLRGQKVIKDGQSAPIKPLHETIAALRLAKYDEAFESPLASTYLGSDTRSNPLLESPGRNDTNSAAAGGGGGGGGGSSSMRSSHKPSHIEVYFPIRFSKTQPHKASECGSLCNGQPHPDKGPVCRFCKKSIAQPHKDTVSQKGVTVSRRAPFALEEPSPALLVARLMSRHRFLPVQTTAHSQHPHCAAASRRRGRQVQPARQGETPHLRRIQPSRQAHDQRTQEPAHFEERYSPTKALLRSGSASPCPAHRPSATIESSDHASEQAE